MKNNHLGDDHVAIHFLGEKVTIVQVHWGWGRDKGGEGWKIGKVRRGIPLHISTKNYWQWKINVSQRTEILAVPNV